MNEIMQAKRNEVIESRRPRPPSAVLKPHLGPHLGCRKFPAVRDFLMAVGRLGDHHMPEDIMARHRAEARAAEEGLPEESELERSRAAYADAAEGRATRAEIGAITAAMLDALPTFDTARAPGYLDGLLFALEVEAEAEPFSAAALAGAAFRILRAETFAPPPDKVLEAVREEQRRYQGRAAILARVLEGKSALREAAA